MLKTERVQAPELAPYLRDRPQEGGFDLAAIVDLVRRQWMIIAGVLALVLAMGAVYVLTAPPRYTAKALMMIDTRRVQPMAENPVLSELNFDTTLVDSQLELLKSDNVAQSVVNDLKLTEDPEFTGNVDSFFGSLFGAIGRLLNGSIDGSDAVSDDRLVRRAMNMLKDGLSVERVKRTYVLEVAFESLSPGKSARIANAVADAYILDQMQGKYEATKRASEWLQERLGELKEEAVKSDRAVQEYRAKNNLVETGGRLISEQQLEKLSNELMQVRNQAAEARARLDRILEINVPDTTDAAVTDALRNQVINPLRQQYLDASRRVADFSARYGPNHQAVIKQQKEMEQIKRAIMDELGRIAEAYKSDFEIARSRAQALQSELDEKIRQTAGTNQAEVALRVLESSAQSYRALYDSFLQRFMSSTQQQSIPTSEARVITPASDGRKTEPRGLMTMAAAGMVGLLGGLGAAFAREQLDRVLKTPRQVEQILGVECLGVLPVISKEELKRQHPAVGPKRALAVSHGRLIEPGNGVERQVVYSPFSRFTETLRGVKVAADMSATTRQDLVIGIISSLPAEGKSTVAANLAQLLTNTGAPTILLDCDLRHPSLSRRLAPKAEIGILELLTGEARLDDVLWHDATTGLVFLPAVLPAPIAHTAEILASAEMERLVAEIRRQYRYVVIDLPPLGPVVDAKAASDLIDTFLLVIEWGRTSPIVINDILASTDFAETKMLGAVLNKANLSALKRLEPYKEAGYYDYYTSRSAG